MNPKLFLLNLAPAGRGSVPRAGRRGGGVRLDAAAPARPHAGVHHDPEPIRRVRVLAAGKISENIHGDRLKSMLQVL